MTEDRGQRTDSALSSSCLTGGSSSSSIDDMVDDFIGSKKRVGDALNPPSYRPSADDIVGKLVGYYLGKGLNPKSYANNSTLNTQHLSLNPVDDHYFERNGVMQ